MTEVIVLSLWAVIAGAITVFTLGTIHEISQSLKVIAEYFAGKKTITLDGPIKIELAKEKTAEAQGGAKP